MTRTAPFSPATLKSICWELWQGLGNTRIGLLLQDINVPDVDPGHTRSERLFNALSAIQDQDKLGNHVVRFIQAAMDPAFYVGEHSTYAEWRRGLNMHLGFQGLGLGEDDRVGPSEPKPHTALVRGGRLRQALKNRAAHEEVLKFIRIDLLERGCFPAVFEATNWIAARIRNLTGLKCDGAELVNEAFLGEQPVLALGPLSSELQQREQKGLANLLIGVFEAVCYSPADAPRSNWPASEQDALDIFSLLSLIHRKLDDVERRPFEKAALIHLSMSADR